MAFFLALKFIDNSMEQMFEERKEEKDANNKKEEMTISGLCPRTTIMGESVARECLGVPLGNDNGLKCRPVVPMNIVGRQ